ncbi:sulfotransferase [Mangrovimicrobium sediminis]|uniref:Sulfotransferase n=1 Tax=Mangrovimicrobium sediminis TaxID=2562682 RepID=A0A4Z0LYQ8_9GAMM|nr:sulfotransferase [Haliea sp. SAOS-164]TGD72297.1 sulfotransferase [Haliea sp. SAOS-164]
MAWDPKWTAPTRFYRSEDYLHEAAIAMTGLTDFGEDDYQTGLAVVLASMDADPSFTPAGRQLAWDAVLLTLMARLYTQEGWKAHPQWQYNAIEKPLVITGLVRSGTTALHKLMGADPQFQGLEHWLTVAPMPRPPREEWESHPAYQRALNYLARLFGVSPEAAATHNIVAHEYDECLELQRQNFTSNRWACTWYSGGYDAWWQSQDERPSFDRYVDILKLIGCYDQRRWLLKNPGTAGHLAWLFEHFPDACVVQMHRHPLRAVPSISSTIQFIHRAFEGEGAEVTAPLLGVREMHKWIDAIEAGYPVREQHEDRFMDVYHKDLHADPMGTIRQIYERFEIEMSADAERLIGERIRANPEGQVEHRYDLADFGLTEQGILARYRWYLERFQPQL